MPETHDALLIHAGALGDFLLSLGLVASLRAAGATRVTVLGRDSIARLAVQKDLVDDVWDIDAGGWHALFSPKSDTLPKSLVAQLVRFDIALDMLGGPSGPIVKKLLRVGVPRVYGVDPRPRADWDGHITDQWGADLSAQGWTVRVDAPKLVITDSLRQSARESLERVIRGSLERCAILHPGSGSPGKCWPADCFLEVARRWKRDHKNPVFLLGPVERERMDRRSLEAFRSVGALESLPLTQVAAVLSLGKQYLGNDSGISHLAAAVGTPSVVVFGATSPRRWAPRGPRVRVVEGSGRWPSVPQVLECVTSWSALNEP